MLTLNQLSQLVQEHLAATTNNSLLPTKWTIAESPLSGRGIMATENILPGEILYVDHPLIYGPRAGTVIEQGCTVCCKIDSTKLFKCHKCALLLCSEECQNSNLHINDCSILTRWQNKIPIEEIEDKHVSRTLTPIRALLLNEKQRQFLSSLQAHILPQHGHEVRDLKEYFDIPIADENFMNLVCCVLDANAFQITNAYGSQKMSMRGLFPVASLMNHNCISNTTHSFDKDYRMTVKAVKHISAGTEIFSCYTGVLWGTPARRRHLYKTKHFMCKCDRCSDPTERGTLLAALKCFSFDCPGSLLPIEPLNSSTAWRCLECSMNVPAKNIAAVQGALGSLMGTLDFGNAKQLENFLVNRVTKYIPRTNQIVVDLQCRLIWILGDTEGLRWPGK